MTANILKKQINRLFIINPAYTKSIISSSAIGAIVLFILINLICSAIAHTIDQQKGPYISCISLNRTFQNIQPKPNIVFLGSSLTRMPFFLADRQHTDYITDYDHYCRGQTLQNILRKAGFKNATVFNFSVDGEMASDAFLITKKLLRRVNAPEWIIYGIAPRDFIDSLLSKETKTPIFDCLFNIADIWSKDNGFVISLEDKLDITLQKSCFIYDKRKNLQNSLSNIFANSFSFFITGQNHPAVAVSKSTNKDLESWQEPDAWNRSIAEYQTRYKNMNQSQFQRQQVFLKNLCKQANKNGSKILLVNMPLAKENINLLPPGISAAYQNIMNTAAQLPGVRVLDLHSTNEFPKIFYRDTAHLNEKGAHHLSMIISDTLQTLSDKNSPCSKTIYPSQLLKRTIDGIASWWLAKAYYDQPIAPDIVILGGSSLGALQGADAYVYNRLIDITDNHRSYVLEHDFLGLLDKKWKVFIGSLPQAMISDQFIISRALFASKSKPKLVVLTFSPRDFIDKGCLSPKETEAYAFFSKYANSDGSSLISKEVKKKCADYYSTQQNNFKSTTTASSLLLGKPFERLCPGEITMNSGDGYITKDDIREFKQCYQNPFSPQLKLQLQYLDDLLSYLKKQNIKAIAFGLPLATANKKLLPKDFWTFYNKEIKIICKKNDADWIDIDHDVKGYKDQEFMDSAHLNLRGGLRLSSTIALYAANKFHWKTFSQLEQNERKMF